MTTARIRRQTKPRKKNGNAKAIFLDQFYGQNDADVLITLLKFIRFEMNCTFVNRNSYHF